MKSLILAMLILFAPFAFAQDEDATVEDDSTQVVDTVDREPAATKTAATNQNKEDSAQTAQKARFRLYPGGQDEQDLQVQSTLPQPQRTHDSQQLTPVVKTTGEE